MVYLMTLNILKNNILRLRVFKYARTPRHCGAGVRWTPLRSRSTDRAGRRDRRVTAVAIRFSFKGEADSFALRTQNDKPFSHCEHRKVRGNPFFLFKPLRKLKIL